MTLHESVEFFVALQTLVIGLSHVLQPRVWVDFFVWLRGKGHAGVFANGFLSLWFGSLLAAFHNVWAGPEMVVTLLGWAQVVKGSVAFLVPQLSMRGFARVSPERSYEFVVAGIPFLALSAVCWYVVLVR
jgi:hypothetical protein